MVYYAYGKKTGMNIFIIPSWYPTPKVPIGGIFVKEQ
ncbi:MAG: hypothetical protein QG617_544, partial [Campylobacterota bacterium]|nr:hypothetical protein [Campylobacterota bacterium]